MASHTCGGAERRAAQQHACAGQKTGLSSCTPDTLRPATDCGCCTTKNNPQQHENVHRLNWQISGMDCPGCARKIETVVRQLDGIISARVLFSSEKLLVEADSDKSVAVEQAVADAGFRLSTAQKTSPQINSTRRKNRSLMALIALLAISSLVHQYSPFYARIAFTLTALVGLWPVGHKAWRLVRLGAPFTIETLMTTATLGALFINATAEAAMVVVLFLLGEQLEAFAAGRARQGVRALMALKPDKAVLLHHGQRETIDADRLKPGDIIEIAAGGRLPADARLLADVASFDESMLTGESLPVTHKKAQIVAAGCTNVDRLVQMEVVSAPGESAIDRILQLIENAEQHRAPVERFLDRFSRYYTPMIMLLALMVAVVPPLLASAAWSLWIYRALTLLLIGCPCALVISTPAAITSALCAAARQGVLIKGGGALETLALVRTVAFDKTGTLTQGKPQLTALISLNGDPEELLLIKAAAVETGSTHPLASAIIERARQLNQPVPPAVKQKTLAGCGIEAVVNGELLRLVAPADTLPVTLQQRIHQLEDKGNTVVVMYANHHPVALFALQDSLREDAACAVAALRQLQLQCIMLTGDNPRAAAAIAQQLKINYQAGLLPAQKVAAIRAINTQHPVAMVGDGINDAPAMKTAAIGIAMSSGSDVALETADAALMQNHLCRLASMVRLARATHSTIRQNIAIALGLKAILLVTSLTGATGLWLAVLADTGATALVTLNALRLLRYAGKR